MEWVNIPKDANLYNDYLEAADTPEGKEMKVPLLIKALRMTFEHFKVEDEEAVGNFILRFSHWIDKQNETIRIDPEDKELNALMDMYEYYQKKAQELIG